MPELAFLTLFLGLVSGVQPVAVSVVGDVARLELSLDGKTFTTLQQPPWRATVDFGPQLLPHTLSARALDAAGKELTRTVQWINLPRPAAEVELQLERDPTGVPRAARLVWQNLTGEAPQKITVSLDGTPDKLDDFEELLRSYGIVELQRTGRVALPKLERESARLRALKGKAS